MGAGYGGVVYVVVAYSGEEEEGSEGDQVSS